MAEVTYVTIPEMTAATAENLSDNMLFETSVPDQNASSGYSSKKVTRGQILSALKEDLNNKANVIISSASGSIAHFEDSAEANAISVIAHIEPVQDLNGYDAPWPAGGGKNLLPKGENRSRYGITFTVLDDGTVTANGTSAATVFGHGGTFTLPAGSYILNGCPSNTNGITMDIRDVLGGSEIVSGADSGNGLTFTLADETSGIVNIRIPSGVTVNNLAFKPMIRLASVSDATYAPYSNICPISGHDSVNVYVQSEYDASADPTATISLGQTVYGGTLDVVSGVLTVDRAMIDLGTLNYTYDASVPRFYSTGIKTSVKLLQDNDHEVNAISSAYKVTAFNRLYTTDKLDGTFAVGNTGTLNFINRTYTTAADFKSAMSGVQLVYELATPQTIQLTPQQVALLVGTNNVWSDVNGDTDVTYKADTKLYIEQLTKPTEDDMVANTAIQSGKFFMVGNRLFQATSTIASGDTINPGTNCTELSLADALNNLN